jgi:hypothetical protein
VGSPSENRAISGAEGWLSKTTQKLRTLFLLVGEGVLLCINEPERWKTISTLVQYLLI